MRRQLLVAEHPMARTTTLPRAFIAAGFMSEEDLEMEIEGNVLRLEGLDEQDRQSLADYYEFLVARAEEEVSG